jgi:uncharacterized protein YdeI (YjbR/CyaY-like superfamily)
LKITELHAPRIKLAWETEENNRKFKEITSIILDIKLQNEYSASKSGTDKSGVEEARCYGFEWKEEDTVN